MHYLTQAESAKVALIEVRVEWCLSEAVESKRWRVPHGVLNYSWKRIRTAYATIS